MGSDQDNSDFYSPASRGRPAAFDRRAGRANSQEPQKHPLRKIINILDVTVAGFAQEAGIKESTFASFLKGEIDCTPAMLESILTTIDALRAVRRPSPSKPTLRDEHIMALLHNIAPDIPVGYIKELRAEGRYDVLCYPALDGDWLKKNVRQAERLHAVIKALSRKYAFNFMDFSKVGGLSQSCSSSVFKGKKPIDADIAEALMTTLEHVSQERESQEKTPLTEEERLLVLHIIAPDVSKDQLRDWYARRDYDMIIHPALNQGWLEEHIRPANQRASAYLEALFSKLRVAQGEFADMVGVTGNAFGAMLKGKRIITEQSLEAICNGFESANEKMGTVVVSEAELERLGILCKAVDSKQFHLVRRPTPFFDYGIKEPPPNKRAHPLAPIWPTEERMEELGGAVGLTPEHDEPWAARETRRKKDRKGERGPDDL